MSKTVAVIGATGTVGAVIVNLLIAKGDKAKVRVLVRKAKRDSVADWEKKGVEVVEGDLFDLDSLKNLTKGADTVISIIQGGPKEIIEGQTNVLNAAKENGVKRFYPSDFSFDYHKTAEGRNMNSDFRRTFFNQAIKNGSVEIVSTIIGGFNDVFFGFYRGGGFNFLDTFYVKEHRANLWGDANAKIDFTSVENAASFCVESIWDEKCPQILKVHGEQLSFAKVIQAIEEVTGNKVEVTHKGSLSDLKALAESLKQKDPSNVYAYLPLTYIYDFMSEEPLIDQSHNSRYPQVQTTSVKDYLLQNKSFWA